MKRILVLLSVVALMVGMLAMSVGPGFAAPGGNAANAAKCEEGGYLDYTDANGNPFKNEGQCTRYAAKGGQLVPTANAQCLKLAIETLPNFNPADYEVVVGTEGDNNFDGQATDGADVFCGFGGNDSIRTLDAGDIFLGGAGNDYVSDNSGTFYGGDGNDSVFRNGGVRTSGTFYGGADNDYVDFNTGTFNGGDGNDSVNYNYGTTDSVENGV